MENGKRETGSVKPANRGSRKTLSLSLAAFRFPVLHFRFCISSLRHPTRTLRAMAFGSALWLVPAAALAAWGAHGMVASDHRLASQAGVEMLQRGGNAVDAAAATSFALGVVNPASCGIGGGGFMLIHRGRQRRTLALDYRETAPALASRDMFVRQGRAVPELSRQGGLAVAVPGETAGVA